MKFVPHFSSSGGNFYTAEEGSALLALEAGVSMSRIRRALAPRRLTDLSGCLITHFHGDHAGSLKGMINASVDVYASLETFSTIGALPHHRAIVVEPRKQVDVGPWKVRPFDVRHDADGSLGYLVRSPAGEKLLFVLDTGFIPYSFRNLDIVAIECNYALDMLRESNEFQKHRAVRHHMGLERVIKFLCSMDIRTVREIHLLHISSDHGDPERFRAAVEASTGRPTYVAPDRRDPSW